MNHQGSLKVYVLKPRNYSAVKTPLAKEEIQVPSLGRKDLLEKEIATHSSILAWEIPWTQEPGRLQSMGCEGSDITERLTQEI